MPDGNSWIRVVKSRFVLVIEFIGGVFRWTAPPNRDRHIDQGSSMHTEAPVAAAQAAGAFGSVLLCKDPQR